jgi:hypothetical protein
MVASAMPVAGMLAGVVHQPLDLALGEVAPLDCTFIAQSARGGCASWLAARPGTTSGPRRCTLVSSGCIRLTRQDVIESSTPSGTPSFHPTAPEIAEAVAGTAGRNWLGSAHLKRAWMCMRQMRPPGRGTLEFLKIAYASSPKNLSKNGFCPLKGGSLSDGGRF